MKKAGIIFGLALAASLAMGGAAEPVQKMLVSGNTDFALELYARLAGTEGNLFVSPYSVSSVLAMTYAGARGTTADEMAATLHFTLGQVGTPPAFGRLQEYLNDLENSGVLQLNMANSLWPQEGYPFLPEYLSLVQKFYHSVIMPLDFAGDSEGARQIINSWVEEKTHEKIKDLIAPGALSGLTRLVLVNAVYFKGDWAYPFKADKTQEGDFHAAPDSVARVPLMEQTRRFPYAETEDCRILKLPYAGGGLSMMLVLPKDTNGLMAIEARLKPEMLETWRQGLGLRDVHLFMPRFEMSWGTFDLAAVLQALGMCDAFNELRADFSGMDGRLHWLYISKVLHKAFIKVNEEGTEAAAATAVVMKARGMPRPPVEFRLDHPFLFWIQEEDTGTILFMGRVTNPNQ